MSRRSTKARKAYLRREKQVHEQLEIQRVVTVLSSSATLSEALLSERINEFYDQMTLSPSFKALAEASAGYIKDKLREPSTLQIRFPLVPLKT